MSHVWYDLIGRNPQPIGTEVPEVEIAPDLQTGPIELGWKVTCNFIGCNLDDEPAISYDDAQELKRLHEEWHAEGMPE